MADSEGNKEVRFDKYCPKCKYWKLDDFLEPCNTCLEAFFRFESEKPAAFEPKNE